MKNGNLKCPKCKRSVYTKNGFSGKGKSIKQKFKCKICGKSFVERNETLSKTEKRLLSLFLNFIGKNIHENSTLKDFLKKYNKEIPGVAKSGFKVEYEEVDITKLENVAVIVCKKEDGIEVIKLGANARQPRQEKVESQIVFLSEFASIQLDY